MSISDIAERAPAKSNVEWGAVFAGAAIATAIGVILLGFGAALGLSVSSPYEGEGTGHAAFAIAAGLYLLWVQLMAFYIGGYVTARLRARNAVETEHEADVRDGLHGFVMWSVGVIAAGVIAAASIGGASAGAAALEGPQSGVVASVAESAGAEVEAAVAEGAAEERASDPQAAVSSEAERQAEVARKFAIISAFITAASLLVGAVAAFFGAHAGGNHRDRNITWIFFSSTARQR